MSDDPKDDEFVYRFEYADGSAFEIFTDGRCILTWPNGKREERRSKKLTNRIPMIEPLLRENAKLIDVIERLHSEAAVLRDVLMNPDPDREPDNVRLHREKCDALNQVAQLKFALLDITKHSLERYAVEVADSAVAALTTGKGDHP